MSKPNCPWCGASVDFKVRNADGALHIQEWMCKSSKDSNGTHQSDQCKISQLKAENERLTKVLKRTSEHLCGQPGKQGA